MYIPSSFRESRIDVMHNLMHTQPLALLVSHGGGGLEASPVPFLVYPGEGPHGTLRAHLAKANPQWRALADAEECLVVFQGAQGYVSPSWYPSKSTTHRVVPTWNYATVHAWGKPRVIENAAWLHRQLNDLTAHQEQRRLQPWSIDDAPADYIATQVQAIIGIEIPISKIEGKWKMSQNRDAADRAGVVAGMRDPLDPHRNPPVADIMDTPS